MVRTLPLNVLLSLCLALMVSCTVFPSTPAPTPVTTDPDPEFNAAVSQAHATMQTVLRAMLAPDPSYTFVGVKVRFTGPSAYEDIWTEPVDYYNGVFTVELVEGVTVDRGLHPERLVAVPLKEILDWMIVQEDGTLLGGYTIRLAFERMTPEEKEEFLEITGYVMD
ncbi:MAG TPA: DUF2314 domain-containing protein [Anaerolineales bacterium]|nr:DUF2314 domain-containing protein [Anaerolineales bacterium]